MTKVRPTCGRVALGIERLEDRVNPATSGVPWPDATHLTLSFVPDGTLVSGAPSSLARTLDAVAPPAVWQGEIVRAFRAWAGPAGIDLRVRADGGQPLGTTGAVQGDDRFGDIRVAGRPLPPGTLATNTSFQWSGTTWSGDVVLNTNYGFGTDRRPGNYDLYSLMLNEAGNVFGVADCRTDRTSAVYHQYTGPRAGLSAADIADIQSLYGPAVGRDENAGLDHTLRGRTAPASTTTVVQAPPASAPQKLNVIAWATQADQPAPRVELFSGPDSRQPLPARVLANDTGTYSIELADVVPGAIYTLRVSAAPGPTPGQFGPYTLGAEFNTQPATGRAAGSSLASPSVGADSSLTVGRNQLCQFALTASGPSAGDAARAELVDAAGRVVAVFQGDRHGTVTTSHTYLAAGTYKVRRAAGFGPAGGLTLAARVASDPIGPGYTEEPVGGSGTGDGGTAPPPDQSTDATWDKPYRF